MTESSDQPGRKNKSQNGADQPQVKLLLICHGEGMQHRYADLGSVNSGLTATGWEQVESVATWLSAHEKVGALYSGPLLQSRLTAQRIGQAVKLPVKVLREFTPEALADVSEAPSEESSTDGPPIDYVRHLPLMDEILSGEQKRTVALVANADAIRSFLRIALQANQTQIVVDHTGITGLTITPSSLKILYINRREHIPSPVISPIEERVPATALPEAEQDLGAVISIYNRVAASDVAQKVENDRERIGTLVEFADLPEGQEMLDVGTGLGIMATMFADAGARSVVGVDISPGMLEQAEYLRLSNPTEATGRVSFRLARMQSLPFPDDRFDAVSCRLVLNHFKSPVQVIQEIVRVLKPGGTFVMAELLSVDDPVKRATQNAIEERRNPSHVAARSAEQYNKIISEAGLEIVNTTKVSVERELNEWLDAYRTSEAVAATVIDMIEAGLETDAAGIGVRKRGDNIAFAQRMYYLKAVKPVS